ncbi:MAG: OsmC family protein [Deltaproteobacteria bacterium]|nr:OsmC family protein [Deltaproteobacteria bacterium]
MKKRDDESFVNGVDVERLVQTIHAVEERPDLALFTFRARTEWIEGAHARTRIQGFSGAGMEDSSRLVPFEGDEPPVLLGDNAGPNAVEAVLHALGSCLVVGFVYNAAAREVRVTRLSLSLEGDLDLHGFLGLSDQIPPGYGSIRVAYDLDCDATPEQIEALWEHVKRTSPVLDILQRPVTVTVEAGDTARPAPPNEGEGA